MIDVAVVHYKANIDWISKIDKNKYNIIIYTKDDGADFIEKIPNGYKIPNRGWESLAYIYHITQYYNKLSDTTIFLQDFPFDHLGNIPTVIFPLFTDIHEYHEYCYSKKQSNFSSDFNKKTMELTELFVNFLNNLDTSTHNTLFFGTQTIVAGHENQIALFYELLNIPKKQIHFNARSMFIVKKQYILNKSLKFWNTILDLHSEPKYGICNKTLPYVLERSWSDIFDYTER